MRRLSTLPIITALILTLLWSGVAIAVSEQCPDGGTEIVSEDMNEIVLDAGTLFCVKAGTQASEIFTSDGVTPLIEYVTWTVGSGQRPNVSHYNVYQGGTSSTTSTTQTTSSTTVSSTTTTTTEVTTPSSTTSTSVEGTTTSIATSTSTTPSTSASSSTVTDPTLPFTGMDSRALMILALSSLCVGLISMKASRR